MLSISVFLITGFSKDDNQDEYYHLKNSWVHMQRVYEQLNLHYVEEINPYPLVKAGIEGSSSGWELVYRLDLQAQGAVVLGVNSRKMEAKAYSIAGERRRYASSPCPGIDHAAAFPVEVVVLAEGESVKVALLDGMYRMKVYFEDAGKLAFAKNMTMPGKIEKEIREMVLSRLR